MSAKSILVVDDNELSLKLMNDILSAEGYRVLNATSGGKALDIIDHEHPDALLLDIMMPGMDGFEVVRRIKANQRPRKTRIVMVSALDDEGARTRLAAAGISHMLKKPIDRWELLALLTRIFSEQGAEHRKHEPAEGCHD
jgi:two-component system sensor histidine kinase ChiS